MAFKLLKAEELFYQPLDQSKSEMIVEDLIPLGLTLVAGAPKSCKSWLMLDMSLAVSSGRQFLGKGTLACGVIYFSLEDRDVRLQNRLLDLGEEPSPNLQICTERKSMDQGFITELKETLDNSPGTRLVIIDTLQKIRSDESSGLLNQYAHDDAEISKLKSFADKNNIALVIVHHLRKMQDRRDPVNEILGSTAMSGVPDQILLLKKDRFRTDGELSAIGRDGPQWKMILRFEQLRWQLIKTETEEELASEQIPDVLFRIADFVQEKGTWSGTATQLLAAVHEDEMQPNILSAKMTKFYYEVFYPIDITMKSKRTANERLLILGHLSESAQVPDDPGAANQAPESAQRAITNNRASVVQPDFIDIDKFIAKAKGILSGNN